MTDGHQNPDYHLLVAVVRSDQQSNTRKGKNRNRNHGKEGQAGLKHETNVGIEAGENMTPHQTEEFHNFKLDSGIEKGFGHGG